MHAINNKLGLIFLVMTFYTHEDVKKSVTLEPWITLDCLIGIAIFLKI